MTRSVPPTSQPAPGPPNAPVAPAKRGKTVVPGTRAKNFKPSLKRMVGLLAPEKMLLSIMLVFAASSVVLSVASPTILGHATNLIFNGVIGGQLEPGQSKAQAVEDLRAQGQDTFADLVNGMDVTPGIGIDFSAVGNVLLFVLALYLVSALLAWAQGYILNIALQRTIRNLRGSVERKIHRLPLKYFDSHTRVDLMSVV
jgi:ATP-binding cassette subfamily B multidrug efflux pump